MRNPNRAIQRQYHKLPTIEEIKLKVVGATRFSSFDLKDAYFHMEIAEESRDLTAFLFEGRYYRYTRMPNGVNAAPEIFQKTMERILLPIPNVVVYIDDILIFTKTEEEMWVTIEKVKKALKENNLTINHNKTILNKERITFLGHDLSAEGFHISEKKTKANERRK